jgi:hypothetical protein
MELLAQPMDARCELRLLRRGITNGLLPIIDTNDEFTPPLVCYVLAIGGVPQRKADETPEGDQGKDGGQKALPHFLDAPLAELLFGHRIASTMAAAMRAVVPMMAVPRMTSRLYSGQRCCAAPTEPLRSGRAVG